MNGAGFAAPRPPSLRPALSVVVTVVQGGDAVPRFLTALLNQDTAPSMEILVPVDASIREVLALQGRFPTVRFLDLGTLHTARAITTSGGQHELYDRRRAAALLAATGELVAILEDRGIPRADWARTAVELHRQPWAVIGGAIEPAPSGLMEWALYICDFSRYALPFEGGPAAWVSDVNVTYKRAALETTKSLWADRFHEPAVHWELQRRGEALRLQPEMVVDHERSRRPLGVLIIERFHWGRLFGYIRGQKVGRARGLLLVAGAPLVPLIVLMRHARVHVRRGDGWRFVQAAPAVLTFLVAWAVGEAFGTLTGKP